MACANSATFSFFNGSVFTEVEPSSLLQKGFTRSHVLFLSGHWRGKV